MWKVITFAIFTIFAAQVSASGNDAIKRTIEDQIAAFKLNDFEQHLVLLLRFLGKSLVVQRILEKWYVTDTLWYGAHPK